MNYSEFVNCMKNEPYTDTLGYRLGYGGMISKGREWPQLVDQVDDSLEIIKVPLYHERNSRYVRVIGFTQHAFKGKEHVTDIIVSRVDNAVIPSGAFEGCYNLKRLTIPQIVRIDENAFRGCDSLEDIYFAGSFDEWKNIDVVSEKHEMEFGDFIPGTPVQKLNSERLVHLPGNDALFSATVHFNCNLDELIPHGQFEIIHMLLNCNPGKMSVTIEESHEAERINE